MPQTPDKLSGRLTETQRDSIRIALCENEMRVASCMFWHNTAPWDVPWRTCPDTFILMPTEGAFRVYLDDPADPGPGRAVAPGEYVMLPEGRRHLLVIEDGCTRLEHISVHAHIADRWGRSLARRFADPFGRLAAPEATWRMLLDVTSLMADAPETGRALGEVALRALMTERIREASASAPASSDGASAKAGLLPDFAGADPRVAAAVDVMRRDLASPALSVEQLARDTGLSPVRFRRLFRQSLGTGPKEYLQRLRLQRAARLLLRTAQPVRRVAQECGFASDHYFHLVFREAFHVTPTEYREQRGP
ncbi:hypothetical protein DB346_03310 [Verrucomicrobia bacterium LW23]|nr:hypothetical protein DB346_03310 [Verrucomicrobia bacterium LW23]